MVRNITFMVFSFVFSQKVMFCFAVETFKAITYGNCVCLILEKFIKSATIDSLLKISDNN